MARSDHRGGFFCWNCGEKAQKGVKNCPHCGAKYAGEARYGGVSALGAGGIGWSDKSHDPFFRRYAGKYTRYSLVWLIALSVLIPAVLLLTGDVEPEGEGILVLIVVPAVIWLVGGVFLLKKFGGRDKSWEGVVENKTEEVRTRTVREDERSKRRVEYLVYVVTIRKQNGEVKQLVDRENASNYLYFNIGDYVRVHETKYLKCIEKYDKSHDDKLFCAACGSANDARDYFCERCGAPMLKGRIDVAPGNIVSPTHEPIQREYPTYCRSCGAKLTGGSFCENCGAKVRGSGA